MSQRFMDGGQIVGYDFGEKKLIVTLTEKTAKKMKADGWDVAYDKQVGWAIAIQMPEPA